MTERVHGEEGAFGAYLAADVLGGLRVCAMPHWLDDELAVELLESSGHNGTSHSLVARLKRLPFVQPFEGVSWRVHEDVRPQLLTELRKTASYKRLAWVLGERFAVKHDAAADFRTRDARVWQWRAAYHYADVDPKQSASRLADLVTDAAAGGRIADLEVAIQLLEQHDALAPFKVELAYARGRLRYAIGDRRGARADLQTVWTAGGEGRMTYISGHLISALDVQDGRADDATVKRLRHAADLAFKSADPFGGAMILNTLLTELLRNTGPRTDNDIEALAERAAEILQNATGYTTLGRVQIRAANYSAARVSLQRAIKAASSAEEMSVALNSQAWLLVKQGKLSEALDIVDQKIVLQVSQGPSAEARLVGTTEYMAKLMARFTELPIEWVLVEMSDHSLAYAYAGHLVVAMRKPKDHGHELTMPLELRGWWVDRADGQRHEIGPTVRIANLLRNRPATVFDPEPG